MKRPGPIIYIFLDGVGIGTGDRSKNPFARFDNPFFAGHGGREYKLPGQLLSTDAHMGIPGLPQSATGQTALFTGYNGPMILGRHVNGYPTFTLRPYFKEKNLLKVMNDAGFKATLVNSYSSWYLKRLEHPRAERMLSASSLMQRHSGRPYFTTEDYLEGRSLYMDLNNWFLRKNGMKIPFGSARASGRKLVQIAQNYDMVVFEYFFTDKVGHEQSWGAAKRIIRQVDDFLSGVWEELDAERDTVVISSDHGNLEDLSVKTHTQNPVGTWVHGKHAALFAGRVKALNDIPQVILDIFGLPFAADFQPSASVISEETT
ncbi:alkaline phosphatase family protein [Turneriella parva]|uniref:Phosphoglycerate mutase n=1 Tax=Turneriella parva (strain ATCC BAA-1111 / DSM 21527 / NCTC 11395 / H) TaxID=869212 RepID=I4B0H6_TURPD|nr:alkaline phosphatase family protein [Turneriella parva]AFM10783.1 phosphoglycerate mutase [Turneriella parva DSM 21527]